MKTNPEYPITYRMKKDGFAWHYNKECELYPTINNPKRIKTLFDNLSSKNNRVSYREQVFVTLTTVGFVFGIILSLLFGLLID